MSLHTQHVEARSRKGRKVVTFHGSNAFEAAAKWDKQRRMLDQLSNRKTTDLVFHLVTQHEEILDPSILHEGELPK